MCGIEAGTLGKCGVQAGTLGSVGFRRGPWVSVGLRGLPEYVLVFQIKKTGLIYMIIVIPINNKEGTCEVILKLILKYCAINPVILIEARF